MANTFDYDISGINRVEEIPSIGQLIIFQKQLGKVQTSYKCNIPEAKDHGWSWTMCTRAQWRLKKGIAVDAELPTAPTDPGLYSGSTNSHKSTHKQKLKLYEQFEEHKRNLNKAMQTCFDPDF